jgi:hypothetical protein
MFTIAHGLTFVQMNLQFMYPVLQKYHWALALCSVPIGYAFIKATKMCYDVFGKIWSGRLLGFAVGIFVFTLLTELVFKEKMSTNTILSVILGSIILLLQLKK